MGIKEWVCNIVQNWIADWSYPYVRWLVIFVGGSLMTWLAKNGWRWVTPLFYGLVTMVCLYVLLFGISPSLRASQSPLGFTDTQIQQLRFVSLGLPRPCFVKVTAVPENAGLRKGFLEIFNKTHLHSLQERHQTLIPNCEFNEDEKDRHPELYTEELS